MDKVQLTKTVVNNMTGYSIGAAVTCFFSANRRHSDNKILDLAIDLSTFVTTMAVGGTIHNPVKAHTDAKIDDLVAWWTTNVTEKMNS
jgi:hypothetical protein